jgi:hypothetical protein
MNIIPRTGWAIGGVLLLMMPMVGSEPISAQRAACEPPPEWGAIKVFGKWEVKRACIPAVGIDSLTAGSASEAGRDQAFVFSCDPKKTMAAMVVLAKVQLDLPMSLTLKGGQAPVVQLEEYVPTKGMTQVVLAESSDSKRFEAALVDGSEPTFTLVITATGKPPVEMTFSRTGLAAAVKPLRSRCGW